MLTVTYRVFIECAGRAPPTSPLFAGRRRCRRSRSAVAVAAGRAPQTSPLAQRRRHRCWQGAAAV
eukprot:4076413-Pleurochrysis_carterae.AAC.1